MAWADLVTKRIASELRTFGLEITYLPGQGAGEPFSELAVLRQPGVVEEASSPGYFADIEVDPDPAILRERKDQVIWPDGTVYLVNKIVRPVDLPAILALHRKASE